jgi:hypothetical protein
MVVLELRINNNAYEAQWQITGKAENRLGLGMP